MPQWAPVNASTRVIDEAGIEENATSTVSAQALSKCRKSTLPPPETICNNPDFTNHELINEQEMKIDTIGTHGGTNEFERADLDQTQLIPIEDTNDEDMNPFEHQNKWFLH